MNKFDQLAKAIGQLSPNTRSRDQFPAVVDTRFENRRGHERDEKMEGEEERQNVPRENLASLDTCLQFHGAALNRLKVTTAVNLPA